MALPRLDQRLTTASPRKASSRHKRLVASTATLTTAFAAVAATTLALAGNAAAAGPVITVAGSPAALSSGRGATVPFIEQEAENVSTNGTILAKNFKANTLAGEASGRRAVQISGSQFVDFTLSAPANSIVVRTSVPDGASGALSITAPGFSKTLPVTSKYGWYYGSYPFNNNIGDVNPHHFYDESRLLFGTTLPAGTVVRLSPGAGTSTYTVDLADFEQVAAPISQPAGSLSVTSYGADPTGAGDSAGAFDQAIAAGRSQGKVVWVPQGTFTINRHIIVDNVTVRGAGQWYSVLHGNGVGVYGNYAPNVSKNVDLSDFAILGEVQERNDSDKVNAIGGALTNSTVTNIWMQHNKVGMWLDGPFDNLKISNVRILDQTADGVNFHNGVTNSSVTNSFLRNTGDDGLAMWAEQNQEVGNSFTNNTVELPILANNIAIYGGRDITVSGNVVSDTQSQGGGLHFANRFSVVPVAGTFTVADNTALRAGNLDPNWQFGVGALWFDARDGQMTNTINVTNFNAYDSPYEAIQFIDSQVTGVHFDGVTIKGTGTFALQLQGTGAASFRNVMASNVGGPAGTYNCQGTAAFPITDLGGNSGWSSNYCGPWPTPVYSYDSTIPGANRQPSVTPTTPTPSPTATTPTPTPTPTTSTPPVVDPNANIARGKPVSASSVTNGAYGAAYAVDGGQGTYWESANNAFPQTLTVDLGAATKVGRAVLKLPTGWDTRTETLAIQGSSDGSSFTTLASGGYVFNPASANTVTIALPGTSVRYLRLNVTGNNGWAAGQISEFEIYATTGGATSTPTPTPTTASPTPTPTASTNPSVNQARGKSVAVSNFVDVYGGGNLTDGNTSSYWESASNSWPATATVNFGASIPALSKVVLHRPPPGTHVRNGCRCSPATTVRRGRL